MKCMRTTPERLKRRKYTPQNIELCDWSQVKSIFDELMNRSIGSASELERYYLDVSDFNSALTEEFCRIQLATSVNTADKAASERFQHFNTNILAPASELTTELDNRFLDSPFRKDLAPERYSQLIRLLENSRDLFRKENIALTVEDSQLMERFNALSGGLSVEFDGVKRNLVELSAYQENTDRSIRERAWRCAAQCKLDRKDDFNSIYDRMILIRTQMAKQAGFSNFRDYQHQRLNRFDYSPADCEQFHRLIETDAVPLFLKRQEKRRLQMGLTRLKPWDMGVDPLGREPLKPFQTQEELITGSATILDRIYPKLGDTLRLLNDYGHLDLMTRQNKAPVGFNMPFDETGVSFVFMNATGQHNDVIVLLHESGHAIETKACNGESVFQYRHTPQEWGECASQSMELLALNHMDVFYSDPADCKRCAVDHWESLLLSLIHTARIDAFQHWVYTNPERSPTDRADKWMELMQQFPTGADYSDLESFTRWSWQSIPHLYIVPFYYIEYGIAQLGAIQVFRNERKEGKAFLDQWLTTMKEGYSQPIPHLYERAGLSFAIHGDLAAELIEFISDEIDRAELK
ncbi:M3 family oligoendopeptidase [bacterium]|nr:M3 family oligoendopeptidase [candidate division CSSED10-310 bacterium]